MNDRHNDLLRIRPEIKKHQTFDATGAEERFQNNTLRPILKLQNPLLVVAFHNYIDKWKGLFYNLSLEKKLAYIENALNKDQKLRNSLMGMVIGHFTLTEYHAYLENAPALNKRIISMMIKRFKDQSQLLEQKLNRLKKTD